MVPKPAFFMGLCMCMQVTNAVGAEELPAEPEKVLLTGANGFLGRFLLLDFLKRVSTK